jgi:hypothetical protein
MLRHPVQLLILHPPPLQHNHNNIDRPLRRRLLLDHIPHLQKRIEISRIQASEKVRTPSKTIFLKYDDGETVSGVESIVFKTG